MLKGRYSTGMFLGTVLTGVLYSLAGEVFYQKAVERLPGAVLIAVYFSGLFVTLGVTVYLLGKASHAQASRGINKRQWLITFFLLLLLSVLFELIYEAIKEKSVEKEISGYLFVLDDSGSMETNDPDRIRYKAVDALVENKADHFQYGIYSFSDSGVMLRDFSPKSLEADYQLPEAEGGTAIRGILAEIGKEMESGRLHMDEGCRIILLSDGYATDISFFQKHDVMNTLKNFAQRRIRISTVGMKNADESLMRLIAEKTGGIYVQADDINSLEEAMSQAAEKNNLNRNLLGYRPGVFMDFWLGLMRAVFIAVLGMVIAVEKGILCERFLDTWSVLISSAAGSVLAGLCIETGMNLLGIHPVMVRIITCILIAFTLLRKDLYPADGENGIVKYASAGRGE